MLAYSVTVNTHVLLLLLLPLPLLLAQVMWAAFGVIWDLRMFGLVGLMVEEAVNLCCDFSAKV
jgi:uncharacterized membrane protein